MTKPGATKNPTGTHRRPGRVRVLNDDMATPSRRLFMRLLAVNGASVPAAYSMLGNTPGAALAPAARAIEAATTANRRKGAIRTSSGTSAGAPQASSIIRDFSDPHIEMIRLLREASEVEHALMIQYLYAAFSVKPVYEHVVGYGDPNTTDFLGVAVQEMQHLAAVNRLLVDLGATPNLERQDFPYEPDIYPFAFNLESISRNAAARFMYTESPAGTFDRGRAKSPADMAFLDQVDAALGTTIRPNHIGSFYRVVIDTLQEVISMSGPTPRKLPELAPWIGVMDKIMAEGEHGHFVFFKDVFTGTHRGFNGHPDVWGLAPTDPAYPAHQLAVTPTAYIGHPSAIDDPVALSLAWLSNLHYWLALSFLTYAYRFDDTVFVDLAKQQMLGPLWSLGRHLPARGVGLPFDPLSMGYMLGNDQASTLLLLLRLLGETDNAATKLEAHLPGDYPAFVVQDGLAEVDHIFSTRAG